MGGEGGEVKDGMMRFLVWMIENVVILIIETKKVGEMGKMIIFVLDMMILRDLWDFRGWFEVFRSISFVVWEREFEKKFKG